MKPNPSKVKNSPHLLAIAALCLAATAPLAQAEGDSSNGARAFLSDPQRVGSLAGTILGGALTAHPIGTLAGSIIGFFVGKETMHKDLEHPQPGQFSYAQRSFIPATTKETAIPMLALETSAPATEVIIEPTPVTTLIASAPPATSFTPPIQNQLPSTAAAAPVVVASLPSPPKIDIDLPSTETLAIAMDSAPAPQKLSPLEQIASLCYGNGGQNKINNPDLQSLCYYHQSS
ncbi:MAG: hypothetical protein U1B30_13670 [Pseudomonadota bacterium]|nr:hypothetical protein [Pseudomonadota bacterium]